MARDFLTYVKSNEVSGLAAEFESLTPTMFREPGFINRYLQNPGVQTAIVHLGGVEAYVIAFRVTDDFGFWIDVAKSIKGNHLDQLFAIINETAKKFGAKYIRFTTSRHGLIKQAQARGYVAEAVLMTKAVC